MDKKLHKAKQDVQNSKLDDNYTFLKQILRQWLRLGFGKGLERGFGKDWCEEEEIERVIERVKKYQGVLLQICSVFSHGRREFSSFKW